MITCGEAALHPDVYHLTFARLHRRATRLGFIVIPLFGYDRAGPQGVPSPTLCPAASGALAHEGMVGTRAFARKRNRRRFTVMMADTAESHRL